jgi:hypothetical protein
VDREKRALGSGFQHQRVEMDPFGRVIYHHKYLSSRF